MSISREILGSILPLEGYLHRLQQEIGSVHPSEVQCLSKLLFEAWKSRAGVFIIGNGGSGTTATHMCEDLAKNTVEKNDLVSGINKRFKILSLTDNLGWILAVGNDLGYEHIFAQQLMNLATPGDLLIAISGSGNSPNILLAVEWANANGIETFGMTGFDGGKLKQAQSQGLHISLCDMGMVESIHLAVFHWVLDDLYARINDKGRYSPIQS